MAMHIPKAGEADKDRFRALVGEVPGTEVKAMFGNLGAFVNGTMFAGLFGPDIGVKVGEDDQQQLIGGGGGPFGPAERPMSGYVTLPEAVLDRPEDAATWIAKAHAHVSALPPKAPKAAKAAKAHKVTLRRTRP
jgi:TfoX/Sxy family transcriptional regulator of competence genes